MRYCAPVHRAQLPGRASRSRLGRDEVRGCWTALSRPLRLCRSRHLDNAQVCNRPVAEIAIDPVENILRAIRNFECECWVACDDECRAGGRRPITSLIRASFGTARPLDRLGPRQARQIGADDRFPRCHDLGAVEPISFERRGSHLWYEGPDGARKMAFAGPPVRRQRPRRSCGFSTSHGALCLVLACGDVQDVYHCRCDLEVPRNRR